VGEVLEPNYVLVNKESPAGTEGEFKGATLTYKGAAAGTVDKVLVTTSNESQDLNVKVTRF
jgi:hypothetical protein